MDIFLQITALSALAVTGVQQILKLNFIPVAFANRYPVPTNILLSIAAAFIAAWASPYQPQSANQWIVFVGLVSLIAAMVYNHLLRNWVQLRATEGEGK